MTDRTRPIFHLDAAVMPVRGQVARRAGLGATG